jgi:glycosyltransferase involved in cell wall biosynthesis
MSKVSVVVPNYNHGPYLRERIDSILNQTCKDFELIILDDYSNDNSVEIIKEYRDEPCVSHVVVNDRNSGSPFLQWEKGIKLATGDYIWIAESDDFASPEFLAEMTTHLDAGADFVYCRSNVVDENGNLFKGYYWADSFDGRRWKSDYSNEGLSEISECLVYRNTIPNASACVFRRNKFKISSSMLSMKYCGDWLFWVDYLRDSRVFFLSRPLSYHRQHGQSTRSMRDFKSEVSRLKEYWLVIRHARMISNKGMIKPEELYNYRWIFEEMFQKKWIIGLRGIFATLPLLLYPFYFTFFVKKFTYKLFR